jgi:mono/diheme cytochrome c family protein
VPDLANLKTNLTKEAWKAVIAGGGKPGTLMPAFAKQNGGPLSTEQIDSLVEYVVKKFPYNPAANSKEAPKKATAPPPVPAIKTDRKEAGQ